MIVVPILFKILCIYITLHFYTNKYYFTLFVNWTCLLLYIALVTWVYARLAKEGRDPTPPRAVRRNFGGMLPKDFFLNAAI